VVRIFILLTFFLLNVQAQNYLYFPEIDQFYNQKVILNPGEISPGKYSVLVGNHAYLPPFGNIGHLYSYGTIGFTGDSAQRLFKHTAGMLVMREKEGEYLGRTRLYGIYTYGTSISEKWRLQAGGYLGVYNYSVGATISTGSISAFAPDGSLGIALHGKRTQLSVSSNQIFNSRLRLPSGLDKSFLIRSWNGLISHQIPWRPFLKQDLNIWYCWSTFRNPFAFVQTTFHFGSFISSGIGFKTSTPGVQYLMGINTREGSAHQFKISGSYFVPLLTSNNVIRAPQLEINLCWIH
jgi:hypothetical protein